jgi:hypothetical protein
METERTRRVVLMGTDTARLLALADELEGRGLEVALYRETARGLAACASGEYDVLVAIGRLAPSDGAPMQRVAVPLVLLDAPDAPDLPLRPIGPRTALGTSVAPAAAADRVLALLAHAAEAQAPGPAPAPQTSEISSSTTPAAPLDAGRPAPAPPQGSGAEGAVSPPEAAGTPRNTGSVPERHPGQLAPAAEQGAGGTEAPPAIPPEPAEATPSTPARERTAPTERTVPASPAARAAPEPPSWEELTAAPPEPALLAAAPAAEAEEPAAVARGPADGASSPRQSIADGEQETPADTESALPGPVRPVGQRWFSAPNLLAILAGFALGLALGFLFLGLR